FRVVLDADIWIDHGSSPLTRLTAPFVKDRFCVTPCFARDPAPDTRAVPVVHDPFPAPLTDTGHASPASYELLSASRPGISLAAPRVPGSSTRRARTGLLYWR